MSLESEPDLDLDGVGDGEQEQQVTERVVTHRILVGGSYGWTNAAAVGGALSAWWKAAGQPFTELTTGATPSGAELQAEAVWAEAGMPIKHFSLEMFHPAGEYPETEMERNKTIVANGPYDAVFMFIKDYSRGAEDLLDRLRLVEIPVLVMRDELILPGEMQR